MLSKDCLKIVLLPEKIDLKMIPKIIPKVVPFEGFAIALFTIIVFVGIKYPGVLPLY